MAEIEYKPYDIDTGYLFPPSLADFLGPDDEVHVFREVTAQLDISYLDADFKGMGQHPYHPRMLLRLLMWGMVNRVVSTRRIEVLVRRDVSYIYLAGRQRPDYRTLARFRRRNAGEIKKLFMEAVLLCVRLGMVGLGHIALDGTKLKAHTSKHGAMSYGRMKEAEERLEREIDELIRQAEAVDREEDKVFGEDNNGYNLGEELQDREGCLAKIRQLREDLEAEKRQEQGLKREQPPVIEEREQRSFADRDARMMLMKRGDFGYGYNGQLCVDEDHGVIVAAELSNQAFDGRHLPGMVEEVRDLRALVGKTDEQPTSITADSGYFSTENIEQEGGGIELLIASGREGKQEQQDGKERGYSLERFDYIKESDAWRCPWGRLLLRQAKQTARGRPLLRRYVSPDCEGCPLRAGCLRVGEVRRSLLVKKKQVVRAEMRARLKRPEKKAIYRKRKWLAEQNIGQIKESLGFRGVTVRQKEFARAQWLFALTVHDVMKAVRFVAGLRRRETALQPSW